jgi:hypothetical protein
VHCNRSRRWQLLASVALDSAQPAALISAQDSLRWPTPAELSDRDWAATPPAVRDLVTQLIMQLESLSACVAQLEKLIGRSSRNSSQPPSSDGSGCKPPARENVKAPAASAAAKTAIGVAISTGAINAIRCRLSESLARLVEEAAETILQDKVAHMDETGGPIGNADGNNPERKRGWLRVMVTPTLAVFQLALSRSAEVAKQILGEAFAGIVVTDRDGAYSWLPLHHRQIFLAHIKPDFTAIGDRSGVSAPMGQRLLELERQLFHQWHPWREGEISRENLQAITTPIRQAIETTLRATTVRTCRRILKVAPALWTFLMSSPQTTPP